MTRAKTLTFDADLAAAIAARVKTMRAELGMTQRELAAASGITHGQVAFIELAQSVPGAASLLGLCRALDLTPNELLGWKEDPMSTTDPNPTGPTILATLTDLSGHPVSVHASPTWAAVPGVYVVARDKSGREFRPALLGVEGARAVRDALTRYLESRGEGGS